MVSVMAVGDSLTNGSDDSTAAPLNFQSWRGEYQRLCAAAGIAIDMIGPRTSGQGGGSDRDHAAWGGATIDQDGRTITPENNILQRLDTTILTSSYQPDILSLQVGWNDQWDSTAAASAPARYTALFNAIRTRRPTMKIGLATLSRPNDGNLPASVVTLNSTITALVAANPTIARLIPLAGLTMLAGDYTDYLHYTASGAAKIGRVYFDSLNVPGWLQPAVSVAPAPTARIFPAAIARVVAEAIAGTATGGKRTAGLVALSQAIGPSYRLRLRRAGVIVLDQTYQGSLPVASSSMLLPVPSSLAALADADIDTPAYGGGISDAGWTMRVGRADDSVYVEAPVGPASSAAPFKLTSDLATTRGIAHGSIVFRFAASIDGVSS